MEKKRMRVFRCRQAVRVAATLPGVFPAGRRHGPGMGHCADAVLIPCGTEGMEAIRGVYPLFTEYCPCCCT